VKFFYQTNLNETVTVRPDGLINMQLVKSVGAAGLTPEELTDRLKKEYRAHLKEPEIIVMVRTFAAQRVFVDGDVARPGTIPLTGPRRYPGDNPGRRCSVHRENQRCAGDPPWNRKPAACHGG